MLTSQERPIEIGYNTPNATVFSAYDFGDILRSLPVIVCCGDIANSQQSHRPRRRSESEAGPIHNPRSALVGDVAPTQDARSDGLPGGLLGFAGPSVLEVDIGPRELDPPTRLPVGQDALHAIMDNYKTSMVRHRRSRTRRDSDS